MEITIILLGIIVSIVIFLAIAFFKDMGSKECPHCNKLYALYEKERKITNKESVSRYERDTIYNKKREIVGYKDRKVYGTRYNYIVIKKCKYCGHECQRTTYEDKY